MSKKLVRFINPEQKERWGCMSDGEVAEFKIEYNHLGDMLANLAQWSEWVAGAGGRYSEDEVELLCPVTAPARILAQGVNYADHRAEAKGDAESNENLLFRIEDTALTAANSAIIRPPGVELLDYEVELAIIIGKPVTAGTELNAANLHEYAVGMCLANDVSARDLMIGAPFSQWYRGKSQRTFLPMGPWIELVDDGAVFEKMELKLWVNGKIRQHATSNDLIHKPLATLQDIRTFTDLAPGDVLLTGTPGGVALKAPNKKVQGLGKMLFSESQQLSMFVKMQKGNPDYLQDGDTVEAEITSVDGSISLGRHHNIVTRAAHPAKQNGGSYAAV